MKDSASLTSVELGHLLKEFDWDRPKAKRLFILWSLMVFPSLVSCLFLVGIPATIFSIYLARRSWKRWRLPQRGKGSASSHPPVSLYQHGFVDQRQSQSVVVSYTDIQTLLVAITRLARVTSHIYTIQTKDNRKIQFDEHLAEIKELGYLLQEQVVQHQLPAAIATYNQGLPITFNRLVVTSSGITVGKQSLSWQEFESVEVIQTRTRKYIHVFVVIHQTHQQKPWALLDQKTFPNIALFFALIDYVQSSAKRSDPQFS
jgi:hypothetical protein